jgi:hypothetical protein
MSLSAAPLRSALRSGPRTAAGSAPGVLQSGWSRGAFTLGASVGVGVGAGLGARTGIAAFVAVGVALVVLLRPAIGALTLVAVVPAISGLRPGFPVPQLRLSEVMIAGIAVLLLVAARPGQTPPWRAFDWLALGYVVVNAVLGSADLLARGSTITIGEASRLLGPAQFFLLYRAVLTTLTSADQRRQAVRLLLFASVPMSVLAILQEVHVPGVPTFLAGITGSQAFLTEVGVGRATGPFAHWHDLGSYMFVIVLIGVANLVRGSKPVMSPKLLRVITALAAIGVIVTVSFTPIAGALIGSLAVAVTARQRNRWGTRIAALIVLLSIAFAPLLTSRYHEQFNVRAPVKQIPFLPQNFNFRITVWTTEFVPVLAKHVITGYGPDLPPDLAFTYTESVYVTLLLRGGLPLLCLYAGLMVALALEARDLGDDPDPDRRSAAKVVFVVIILVVFMQVTTNYFVNAGFPHLFWILAALLMARQRTSVGRGSPVVAPLRGMKA